MKAISLTQPWASLMAIEAKRNETRSWPSNLIGDIAICSTKEIWKTRVPSYADAALTYLWMLRSEFGGAFEDIQDLYFSLPFGKVICVVEKTGCISTNDDNGDDRSLTEMELALGDYSANRFYFPTRNCRVLSNPIPIKGALGFFNLPPEIEQDVLRQIAKPEVPA